MSLTQKLKDAVSGGTINITSLCIGTLYLVLHCDRIGTNYGDVLLTIRDEAEYNIVRVFLPRHYGSAIYVDGMASINNRRITYYLTYKRKSASSDCPMLQIDV